VPKQRCCEEGEWRSAAVWRSMFGVLLTGAVRPTGAPFRRATPMRPTRLQGRHQVACVRCEQRHLLAWEQQTYASVSWVIGSL
jgi:hypothetical protein